MQKSEQIEKLVGALCKFQGEVKNIEKNRTAEVKNKEGRYLYSYKYADLGATLDGTKPALIANGLSITQLVDNSTLKTVLMHISGQWVASESPITPKEPGSQAFGSAVTYIRRYARNAILDIHPEDDDDGKGDSSDQSRNKQPPPQNLHQPPQQTDTFADVPGGYTAKIGDDRPPSDAQIKRFYAIAKQHGWYEADYRREIKRAFSKENERQLNRDQYNVMCDLMQRQTPGPVMNTDDAFGN